MYTKENQSEALQAILMKYGYSTNRINKEFIQMPIDHIQNCLKYFKTMAGFFDDKSLQYKADLDFLLAEQNKLAN